MRLQSTGDDASIESLRRLITHYLILVPDYLVIDRRIHRGRNRNQLSRPTRLVNLRRGRQLVGETISVPKIARAIPLAVELRLYVLLCLILPVFALCIELLQLNLKIRPRFQKRSLILDFHRVFHALEKSVGLAIRYLRLVDAVEFLAL